MFSVALSIASRRPAVSRHPALRSPDFPLHNRDHAAIARPASKIEYHAVGPVPGCYTRFTTEPNIEAGEPQLIVGGADRQRHRRRPNQLRADQWGASRGRQSRAGSSASGKGTCRDPNFGDIDRAERNRSGDDQPLRIVDADSAQRLQCLNVLDELGNGFFAHDMADVVD